MVRKRATAPESFTIERANATLPLVRAIVSDFVRVFREVLERRRRLAILMDGRDPDRNDPYHQELVQIQEELDKDRERLQQYVEELVELGIEPPSGPEGLIDFPTVIEGRKAYLTWRLDEPEVLYWRELDVAPSQRQPLAAGSLQG